MKKLFILLAILFSVNFAHAETLTVDTLVSPDDVTLVWLNDFKNTVINFCNSIDGANIQAGTVSPDAFSASGNIETFRDEAFNDWIYSGLLPGTGTRVAATISSGTAYVGGVRLEKGTETPGESSYPATKYVYVDLDNNGEYHYTDTSIGASEPTVYTNSIRLARVTTNATDVTTVRDDRVLSISLGSNEDFYIAGMELISAELTAITVEPGVVYHGSTRIEKTSDTGLRIGTAGNWWDGVVDSGSATWYYVGVNSSGTIAWIGNNPPDKSDTSGNSGGKLLYWYDGSEYWRVIGRVRVNTSNVMDSIAWRQTGAWLFYTGPVTFTVPSTTANQWKECDLSSVCSAIDSMVQLGASDNTGGANCAFRIPDDAASSMFLNTMYCQSPNQAYLGGLYPLTSDAKLEAMVSANIITGYVSAVKLSIRE